MISDQPGISNVIHLDRPAPLQELFHLKKRPRTRKVIAEQNPARFTGALRTALITRCPSWVYVRVAVRPTAARALAFKNDALLHSSWSHRLPRHTHKVEPQVHL